MKPGFLLSLFMALPISAATITLTPSTPKTGDSVVVTIHDFGGCPPATLSAKLEGQLLTIDLVTNPDKCESACPAVVTPISYTTQPFVFSQALPYTIEYAYGGCGRPRRVAATTTVLVRPACAFDRSLTISATDAPTRRGASFRWCDPSYSPFPDAGESATNYRLYLVREGSAPILVDEHKPNAGGTSSDVNFAPNEVGATGAFVEADICNITIAGCSGISKVLKTNIVPLSTAANNCTFGGTALCLADRFTVTARYHTDGGSSPAHPVAMTKDSGYFWFFGPNNAELVVKIVDACALKAGFWFFAAGLTDVGVDIVVEDTKTGVVRRYSSPAGTAFMPIQDTSAFPGGCP